MEERFVMGLVLGFLLGFLVALVVSGELAVSIAAWVVVFAAGGLLGLSWGWEK